MCMIPPRGILALAVPRMRGPVAGARPAARDVTVASRGVGPLATGGVAVRLLATAASREGAGRFRYAASGGLLNQRGGHLRRATQPTEGAPPAGYCGEGAVGESQNTAVSP